MATMDVFLSDDRWLGWLEMRPDDRSDVLLRGRLEIMVMPEVGRVKLADTLLAQCTIRRLSLRLAGWRPARGAIVPVLICHAVDRDVLEKYSGFVRPDLAFLSYAELKRLERRAAWRPDDLARIEREWLRRESAPGRRRLCLA